MIITEPKRIRFNVTPKVDCSLNYEVDHIIKHNRFLTEHKIKNKVEVLLFKYKDENDINEHRKY